MYHGYEHNNKLFLTCILSILQILCHLSSPKDAVPEENHPRGGGYDRHLDLGTRSILPIPGYSKDWETSESNQRASGIGVRGGLCGTLRDQSVGRGPHSGTIHRILLCTNRNNVVCLRQDRPSVVD